MFNPQNRIIGAEIHKVIIFESVFLPQSVQIGEGVDDLNFVNDIIHVQFMNDKLRLMDRDLR